MNLKQALERIEALERRVKELESRPEQHIHYHQYPAPAYTQPEYTSPLPQVPWVVTCGQIGAGAGKR